jgi:hypothetical protein
MEHSHFYTAKVQRTGQVFKFGFANDYTDRGTSQQIIHGLWASNTEKTIETVEKVDLQSKDVLILDNFGTAQVRNFEKKWLDSIQLRFVTPNLADQITKIIIVGTGKANV